MTTSFIGYAGAEADSVALPSHQAGDLIVICAFRHASTTIPTVPSGWGIVALRNQSTRAQVIAIKTAASSSEVSGTWTNAQLIQVIIFRGSANYLTAGSLVFSTNSSATAIYPDLDLLNSYVQRASSWVLGCITSSLNSVDIETPPSGMTNRGSTAGASAGKVAFHDSNGDTTWPTVNVSLSGSTVWCSNVIEIWDTGIPKASGGVSRPSHPLFQQVIG